MPMHQQTPTNQWYVAAFGREIGPTLFARTVRDEPIVFYRRPDGTVAALADRCVHRRYPLSASHLDGDRIVCGYHGFTYGGDGVCVSVPGQQRIPRTARVRTYPVVERDSFVWVWIGDPDRADPTAVPRAPWLDDQGWTTVGDMTPLAARHGLLMDNLLDLSHETYLHGGHIGTPEVADTPITTTVDDDAEIVYVSRRMDDAACPPFYARSTGITGRITRWQDIEFHPPCLYILHSRIAPQGHYPPADGPDAGAFHAKIVYALTPATATTTWDFWAVARDFARADTEVSDFLYRSNATVVDQDVTALTLLEAVVAGEADRYQELSINIDTGGLAARRIVRRQVDRGAADLPVPAAARP